MDLLFVLGFTCALVLFLGLLAWWLLRDTDTLDAQDTNFVELMELHRDEIKALCAMHDKELVVLLRKHDNAVIAYVMTDIQEGIGDLS